MGTMMGPDKKSHKIVAVMTSKDTWVKTKGGWKMSSMTVVSSKMTSDGKPFNPGGPTPAKAAGKAQ